MIPDRHLIIQPGQSVTTAWISLELCVIGCRDRMAVGDVENKYRELLQLGGGQYFPPVIGHWREDGRFVVCDGRHTAVAALMIGRESLFVGWITESDQRP